ncbi:MAG: hypothetical protein COX43_03130 [Parcubacteria group bacterium CG23_combo_of_CG06-09_8_20_14_all_35_9]|nr:MAG: hypothetical protein COX43_03130 [Parcubacteria group bacterium CG23_combo_of_CG06-09_8_20_14_all_35_9]
MSNLIPHITYYILLILYFLFFAFISWRNITWAIALIIVLLPSYLIRFHIWFVPMTLLEGMILILFASWIIKKCKMQNAKCKVTIKNLKLDNWIWPLLAWIAAATMAMIVSPDKRAALGIWKAYFIEPILFFIVFINTIKTKKDLKLIFWAMGVSAFFVSVLAIYQKFTGWGIPNPLWQAASTRRVTSFFGYPNAIGLYLGPIIVLFFGFSVTGLKKYLKGSLVFQFLCFLVIISALLSIIWSRSEGAWLGALVGIIFIGFILSKKSRVITMIAVAILLIVTLSHPQIKTYILREATFQGVSGKIRLEMWQETVEMLCDHLIFGAGLSGYQKIFSPYHKARHIEVYLYPHNIFLNFYSELGLTGLIIFFWIVIKFFKAGLHTIKTFHLTSYTSHLAIALMAAMICLLIHGFFDVPYFKNDLSVFFWLLIGLLVVSKNFKEEQILP